MRKKIGVAALLLAVIGAVFGLVGSDESFVVSHRTGTGLTDFREAV